MHDFLLRRTLAQCAFGMAADAIRTLRDMGHGHGDQLLGLARQCAVDEDTLAEGLERGGRSGRELLPLALQLSLRFRVHLAFHGRFLDK